MRYILGAALLTLASSLARAGWRRFGDDGSWIDAIGIAARSPVVAWLAVLFLRRTPWTRWALAALYATELIALLTIGIDQPLVRTAILLVGIPAVVFLLVQPWPATHTPRHAPVVTDREPPPEESERPPLTIRLAIGVVAVSIAANVLRLIRPIESAGDPSPEIAKRLLRIVLGAVLVAGLLRGRKWARNLFVLAGAFEIVVGVMGSWSIRGPSELVPTVLTATVAIVATTCVATSRWFGRR